MMKERLIRYEDLIPCKAAFIDAKTPGSDLKDNYSIIGGGVSESIHQKVNLSENHGFCVGAAGQPPRVTNSSHSHFTAEVFIVHSSIWRFYWNNDEKAAINLHPGDVISLPTNMFRGFENVGDEYGMIFSVLGHDNAGGGVEWLPKVIEEAKDHGLILLENGKLVDTTIGEKVPKGSKPMSILTEDRLKTFNQYTVAQMKKHVGFAGTFQQSTYQKFPNKTPNSLRWIDLLGPEDSNEHEFAAIQGDPNGDGFNIYGLQSDGIGSTGAYIRDEVEVLFVHRGEFEIFCLKEGKEINVLLKKGDIFTFPKGAERNITAKTYGFAYFIVGEDHPKAPKLV